MRTRMIGVAALGAAVVVLAGCSGGGSGEAGADVDFTAAPEGTLTAWAFNNADDVGQARLDYAAGQLSDVDVELDATAFDAQKFTTRLASGDVPDVVQMDRTYVAQYAAQGLLVPLDECYATQDVDPSSYWYEGVIDDVTYDGQVWAGPQFYQPPAILVNMDVATAAGVAPEDFDTSDPDRLLAAITTIYAESGGVPTRLGFDPVATGTGQLWVLGQGGQIYDDDGMPTLDDPSNVAGLELLKQITDAQGGFAKVKSFSDSFDTFGDNNQFVADQVGAQVVFQWYPNVLSPYLDQVDVRAVPFLDSDGQPFTTAGGSAFVIPFGAENPAAACAWITAVNSPGSWTAAGDARGATREADGGINTGLFTGVPEADDAIREQWVVPTDNADFDEVISTFYDILPTGTSPGASPAGQTAGQELNNAITAALLGEKSAEEALADAQAAAMRAYDDAIAAGG